MGTSLSDASRSGRFIPSSPLDPFVRCCTQDFRQLVQTLGARIDAAAGGKQKRRSDTIAPFCTAIEVMLLNLDAAARTSSVGQVSVDLAEMRFRPGTPLHNAGLTYRTFKQAYDGLLKLGLFAVEKQGTNPRGSGYKAYRTRIAPTQTLIDELSSSKAVCLPAVRRLHEPIQLKQDKAVDSRKPPLPVPDTREVRAMAERVEQINRVLLNHWVDIYISDAELEKLQGYLARRSGETPLPGESKRYPINFSQRTVYRVFNNSSLGHGGRFYGPWWQNVPNKPEKAGKAYRRYITIDDKQTVELDYSSLHPTLIYTKRRLTPPSEPYDIGLQKKHRSLIKRTFNALINAGKGGVRQPRDFKPDEVGMSWQDFQARIMELHKPVEDAFYSGEGLRLQRTDSEIAEKVMLHFAKHDIPCLPVHDSFLMHHGYKEELEEVMNLAFEAETGASGVQVKVDEAITPTELALEYPEPQKTHQTDEFGLILGSNELEDILASEEPYSRYEERLSQWRKVRS